MIKNFLLLVVTILLMMNCSIAEKPDAAQMVVPYTLADRDRGIRMEARMDDMIKQMNDMNLALNKRMDDQLADTKEQFVTLKTFMDRLILIFLAITGGVFAFAWWDSRTMIRPVEQRVGVVELELEVIKKDALLPQIMTGLRQLGKSNPQVQEFLKNNNLL